MSRFLSEGVKNYPEERDRPDHQGTSRLSPYLHFGEVSVRSVWLRTKQTMREKPSARAAGWSFLRQIAWREFSQHLLFHFPNSCNEPLRPEFKDFPWKKNARTLKAWQKGMTGYPIVDAGMRELWTTGWMHNRVRMIVASFLVKDLLIDWKSGAEWFWDTLVDANLGNNTMGWQWVAGCGADAAPFFRVFNPTTQAKKFDPDGDYIRKWVPELSALGNKTIHAPGEATEEELKAAGITLGKIYPRPIVDHAAAREAALDAFETIRKKPPTA